VVSEVCRYRRVSEVSEVCRYRRVAEVSEVCRDRRVAEVSEVCRDRRVAEVSEVCRDLAFTRYCQYFTQCQCQKIDLARHPFLGYFLTVFARKQTGQQLATRSAPRS